MSKLPINNTSPATVLLHGSASQPATIEPDDEIYFHQPHPDDILFMLPRLDRLPTSSSGVHYGTALTACQIVANSRERVNLDLNRDRLLTKFDYWFIVPADGHPGTELGLSAPGIPNWPRPPNPPGVDMEHS
ncbi:hypothetical protein EV127DRAFT_254095 [Xylaria flabelliformis]|nr:hypothetical protein EV127DRAFT_254095 [Xylaria flabelliformis]